MYLALILTSISATLFYGVYRRHALRNTKRFFKHLLIAALVSIPIVGLAASTQNTHAFDIPWWFFGLVNGALMLLAASMIFLIDYLLKISRLL